ncbi:MAG: hypothetical protein QXO71_09375 [Candidatus Jordarchaeaceae archaeon]
MQEDFRNVLSNDGKNVHLVDDPQPNDSLIETPALSLPEVEVLLLFNNGDAKLRGFSFGFQGIRRRLEIHQQTLTIALRRLLEKGIIAKNDDQEYFLTKQGGRLVSNLFSTSEYKMRARSEKNNFTSCEINMKVNPKRLEHKTFARRLKGKWFSHYRYVGSLLSDDKSTLEWITDDANCYAQVSVDRDGNVRIIVYALKCSDGMNLATEASRVSIFVEKNIKELFGESPTYKVEVKNTRHKPDLDPADLSRCMGEVKSQILNTNS